MRSAIISPLLSQIATLKLLQTSFGLHHSVLLKNTVFLWVYRNTRAAVSHQVLWLIGSTYGEEKPFLNATLDQILKKPHLFSFCFPFFVSIIYFNKSLKVYACAGVYTGVYESMCVPFDGLLVRRHQERFLWLTETFTHQSRSLGLVLPFRSSQQMC